MSQVKQDKHLHKGWIKTAILACIVAVLAIASFWYGVIINEISWSIAGVGIITFFGMLAISSYHSLHQPNSTGTLRKAIAASMISVYIVVLSLLFSDNLPILENEASMTLMSNFSYVIMTIIAFYFGSKGATEFLKIWKGEKNGQT
jgi:peptidoglycan/LPS O-acetylase OafA/YrhL